MQASGEGIGMDGAPMGAGAAARRSLSAAGSLAAGMGTLKHRR